MLRTIVLYISAVTVSFALDPNRNISQYEKRTWQVENGLPQNFVNSIGQDNRGELLVATEGGLARFDGARFTPFSREARDLWRRQWITVLRWAKDGTLWAGSRRSGVYRSGPEKSKMPDTLANLQVQDILLESSGTEWVLAMQGIWQGKNGHFQRRSELSGVDGAVWQAAAEGKDGSLWLVTTKGLVRIRGDQAELVKVDATVGQPRAIHKDRFNRLWLGTGLGLYQVEPASRVSFRQVARTAGVVTSIMDDRHGNLWLGTWGGGIYRVGSAGATRWSTKEGLADDFVRCLYEDSEGNLWIGTRSGGISRWKDTAVVPFGASEGLGGNFASAVVSAPDGRLYLGTWRSGLAWFEGGAIRPIPLPLRASEFLVRSLAVDTKGALWVGSWQGLFRGGVHGIERVSGDPRAHQYTTAVHFDHRGGLWLGSEFEGLLYYPNGEPNEARRQVWLSGEGIGAIVSDSDGSVLVSTTTGVVRIAGNGVERITQSSKSASLLSALLRDRRGRIWSAAPGNIIVVADGWRIFRFGPEQGFPHVPVFGIAEDRSGDIWTSTAQGIYRIRGSEMEALLTGDLVRVDSVRLGDNDGMRSSECHGKSHPIVATDGVGDLWFPTVRGFVRVRPGAVVSPPAPAAWLSGIKIGGIPQPPGSVTHVPAGSGPIEIAFNAISLTSPERLLFRHRLRGYESDWTFAGGGRTVSYTRLPGGSYNLEVSVRHPGGAWGEAWGVAVLEQQAAFRETAWFAVALAALGGLAAAGGLWLYGRLRRSGKAAVRSERERIAREWHDTLLADFAAVSWQLEATREKLSPKDEASRTSLELARAMVRHSQTEARRLIHELRESEHEEATSLDASLLRALERLNASHATQASLEVVGSGPPMAFRRRRDILMICQEAVANALRHSRGTRVDILLDLTPPGLRILVADDGVGLPGPEVEQPPGHFGIRGMRERAVSLGAELRFETWPGRGTRVTLLVPEESLRK